MQHLPMSYYFDENHYGRERHANAYLQYVGTAQMVPNVGDYVVLEQFDGARVLMRTKSNEVVLLSNVCRHRQAQMLRGKGNLIDTPGMGGALVCPLHKWSYDALGQEPGALIGAARWSGPPVCAQKHSLERFALHTINGMLFTADSAQQLPTGVQGFDPQQYPHLQLDDKVLFTRRVTKLHYNWKTFMEVFNDNYHVDAIHAGLSNMVDTATSGLDLTDSTSVQHFESRPWSAQPNTGCALHDKAIRMLFERHGALAPQRVFWGALYPNVTIESYTDMILVGAVIPIDARSAWSVYEVYCTEELAAFEPELIQSLFDAHQRTQEEDDELSEWMEQGRYALYRRGTTDEGPHHQQWERGMIHWTRAYLQALKTGVHNPVHPLKD